MGCESTAPFLYGTCTKSGANSFHTGDRPQWSVQVTLNQLPGPLGHLEPIKFGKSMIEVSI